MTATITRNAAALLVAAVVLAVAGTATVAKGLITGKVDPRLSPPQSR